MQVKSNFKLLLRSLQLIAIHAYEYEAINKYIAPTNVYTYKHARKKEFTTKAIEIDKAERT